MLDTAELKHISRTLPNYDFQKSWRYMSRAKHPTWVHNVKGKETRPNLTIINTPDGLWHSSARVSLPKMLYGHNTRLPYQTEVDYGLETMAEYFEQVGRLPFDAATAIVSCVHFAYDIQLTEPGVWAMIEKLSKKKMKPLLKDFYEDSTLYFKSKGKTRLIRIYPKFQEVLARKRAMPEAVNAARGNLRFESCFLEKDAIDALVKKYDLPNSRAQTLLTESVSDLVISELLEKLNFFDLLTDEKTTLQKLMEYFPAKRAMSLCGFRQMVEEHGENFYKDESVKFSKSSYSRNARDCRKARVW